MKNRPVIREIESDFMSYTYKAYFSDDTIVEFEISELTRLYSPKELMHKVYERAYEVWEELYGSKKDEQKI